MACGLVAIASTTAQSADVVFANETAENAPEASFDIFLDRLMGAESGGRSNAKNPRSTALGAFQFIKSTFLELTHRHFPTEVAGLSDKQILQLRIDRDFSRRTAAAFSKDNIGYLKKQGFEPTFAHLRLAFLLGPADAARVMRAAPEVPAAQILSSAVIKANPFMTRMSASDLLAKCVREVTRDSIALATAPLLQTLRAPHVRPSVSSKVQQLTTARKESCNRKLASCRKFAALRDEQRKSGAGRGKRSTV